MCVIEVVSAVMTEASLTPHKLVKSTVNPFLHAAPDTDEEEKEFIDIRTYTMVKNVIPGAGCRVRRTTEATAEQVGTIEWDVYPGNCIKVTGSPVCVRPPQTMENTPFNQGGGGEEVD